MLLPDAPAGVSSWLYQQLVRLLFRLEVRDTQVGLKVFRREVAEQVLPLLLVKRFAFDLELLAVARAFGFDRIRELPIRLDYRFSGPACARSPSFARLSTPPRSSTGFVSCATTSDGAASPAPTAGRAIEGTCGACA